MVFNSSLAVDESLEQLIIKNSKKEINIFLILVYGQIYKNQNFLQHEYLVNLFLREVEKTIIWFFVND